MTQPTFQPGADFARQLDAQDELKAFREEFVIDDPNLIYLDGNSLGRLPKATAQRMRTLVEEEWGKGIIRGWNRGWWDAPARIGAQIAQLIGAKPNEVIVGDSTSVNLFKVAVAALRMNKGRTRIVSDVFNFPSDLYILQGAMDVLGNQHELVLAQSRDTLTTDLDDLYQKINQQTALVELSHVVFKSGYLYDLPATTRRAHDVGAFVIWDLCHSVGAVPMALHDSHVDMAIGCTYKYLNSGPGAPAFIYVREDLQDKLSSPLWGWAGQHKPFDFELEYQPAAGMHHFLTGTPYVLSASAIEPAVELMLRAGMEKIRAKSIQLTEYMIYLIDHVLTPHGFALGSPRAAQQRGSHVSIRHRDAYRINRAMIERMNIIPDFRPPDNIRLGLAPLYTTFVEIHDAVQRIAQIMDEKIYEQFSAERAQVT